MLNVKNIKLNMTARTKEEVIEELPFMRISKSMIVNIEKILHISPALGGRFEAVLENDEKVIISRLYVPILKNKLGVSR